MGNILLITTATVIIGLYGLGVSTADKKVQTSAETNSVVTQAVEIAKTALEFAIYDLHTQDYPTASNVTWLGGTYSYSTASLTATEVKVTSVGTYSGYKSTIVAIVVLKPVSNAQSSGKNKWVWTETSLGKVYTSWAPVQDGEWSYGTQ